MNTSLNPVAWTYEAYRCRGATKSRIMIYFVIVVFDSREPISVQGTSFNRRVSLSELQERIRTVDWIQLLMVQI